MGIATLFLVVGIIFGISVYVLRGAFSDTNLREFAFQNGFVQDAVIDIVGEKNRDLVEISPELLGFVDPMTYLVLFKNNTEMRPGGGFIGSYAVIRIDEGNVEVLVVDGTENLDRNAPASWKKQPPVYLQAPLGVDRWYFRDSNWSIDFPTNAEMAMEFYAGEGGLYADEIDGVVAFTPTLLERVLEVTGPIEVEGMTFNSENVTEKLEYEVEFGYKDKGIPRTQRKAIIFTFLTTIQNEMEAHLIKDIRDYVGTFGDMMAQKHVLVYLNDGYLQERMSAHDYDGKVEKGNGDYLMYADANLSALKTDHALERTLNYKISKQDGKYIGVVEMDYKHTGEFDWRTTRYRSFARVYVPEGSKLMRVEGTKVWPQVSKLGQSFTGSELGLTWFGAYTEFEPGTEHTLRFVYELSPNIVKLIEAGQYTLKVEKQSGTVDHSLTLDLDFGTNVRSASPAEEEKYWGDSRYQYWTGLAVDRDFDVSLQ